MGSKDYYSILGISYPASSDDIKRAYRKLALKYHPDKDKRYEGLYREIKEAYEILKDENKRVEYDNKFKTEKFKTEKVKRGSDLSISLDVSIQDLFFGISKPVVTIRKGLCPSCLGTGSEDKKTVICPICRGSGIGSMSTIDRGRKCGLCNGIGSIPDGKRCQKCHGTRFIEERIRNEIRLDWDHASSSFVKIPRCGNCFPGGETGDLNVNINMKSDPMYSIRGSRIIRKIEISPAQAIIGDVLEIDVFGQKIKVVIPSGSTESIFILQQGDGAHFSGGRRGDIEIKLQIKIPEIEAMTDMEKELYKKLLTIEKESKHG